MLSRPLTARSAHSSLRMARSIQIFNSRRGLASAASSSSGLYDTSDHGGIKVASRDGHAPTTTLAVVAKAGTRYQPLPGLTAGLEEFAFKNTLKRSALRITRESELLGGQLNAYHTREALVIEANFLRNDLPYFAELLGEVVSQTQYSTHEFHEDVERVMHLKQAQLSANAAALALDAAHSVAFHSGLGTPLYPTLSTPTSSYLSSSTIAAFASAAYTKPNIALVIDGASQASLSKWLEHFFKDVPATSSSPLSLNASSSQYFGGESRISHAGSNSMVIAFPGSSYASLKPEFSVLTALMDSEPSVKWAPGFSLISKALSGTPSVTAKATNFTYSDAGLFTMQFSGSAASVRKAAEDTVKALKSILEGSVNKELLTKAIAKAKFDLLDGTQIRGSGLIAAGSGVLHTGVPFQVDETVKAIESLTVDKLKSVVKNLLDGKATVAAVGDLYVLPFAAELGLAV